MYYKNSWRLERTFNDFHLPGKAGRRNRWSWHVKAGPGSRRKTSVHNLDVKLFELKVYERKYQVYYNCLKAANLTVINLVSREVLGIAYYIQDVGGIIPCPALLLVRH